MRTDWIAPSAATLVIGAFALVLGTVLSPGGEGDSAHRALEVVLENEHRMFAIAVFYFVAALGLLLGLPSLLSLFVRRARRLGLVGVMVFAVGVLGVAAFAMLLVFFRALVIHGSVAAGSLDRLSDDLGLVLFVYVWIAGFYGGLVLIAFALFRSRATPAWVPVLLLVAVAILPVAGALGAVGPAIQTLTLALAFTGVAVTAVSADHAQPQPTRV